MIETILVASDGSQCGQAAEGCAIAMASKLGASLTGVTVIEDRLVRPPASEGLNLPAFPEAELAAFCGDAIERSHRRIFLFRRAQFGFVNEKISRKGTDSG